VDLGEILRILRNRWYIVVPMMVLAVGLAIGTYIMVPTTYTTYTMVSLLAAPTTSKATAVNTGQDNPFLNFNGSLVATADFLGRRLQSTDTQLELKAGGLTEKYEVALAENAQGPFLTITLTGGDDKEHLLASANQLAAFADKTLSDIQKQNNVAEKDRITLTQVIAPQKPEAETKEKLKLVIVAGGGTAAFAFVLTFIVESIARARRRKALGETAAATMAGAASASPDIEGTMVLQLPPKAPPKASVPVTPPPPQRPLPPKEPENKPDPEKTQRLRIPSRPVSNPPAENRPQPGAPRAAAATTYQSNGGDRRGQDAGRVNGS
jgi:capsular polysaccharide biosynthesis protein